MKKLFFSSLYLIFYLFSYGQASHFYDENGTLKLDDKYRIDTANLETVCAIEKNLINEILPTINYPQISIELGNSGNGVLKLTIVNTKTTLKIVEGVDPYIDKYMRNIIESNISLLINDLLIKDIEMFIPYSFLIEVGERKDTSSLTVLYPGTNARLIENNIYLFEYVYKIEDKDILHIDDMLPSKIDECINNQLNGNLIDLKIVYKEEYLEYMNKVKMNLLQRKKRIYYTLSGSSKDRLLRIIFSDKGFNASGGWNLIYNVDKGIVEDLYTTYTQ